MFCRKDTQVSPAARAVGGVNVAQPQCGPPAILLHTAVPAARGLADVIVSAASQATGTTAPLGARVSQHDVHIVC